MSATALLLALLLAVPADADACTAPAAAIADAVAAMRTPPTALAAATNVQQAMPSLAVGEHYLVTLAPEGRVAFIVPPGRAARDAQPYGGILYLDVRESGRYRIALDTRHWIDVIDSGPSVLDAKSARSVASVAHRMGDDCRLVRKAVDFDLDAGTTYRVHLSGVADARVSLVVTRSEATDAASP